MIKNKFQEPSDFSPFYFKKHHRTPNTQYNSNNKTKITTKTKETDNKCQESNDFNSLGLYCKFFIYNKKIKNKYYKFK